MPLIEFSHRPPNEVLSRAQMYVRAWNTEVNRVLASPDADKAARLLNTSDHIVGQLSTASFRTGLTSAQTTAIDQLLNRFGSIANARRPGLERIARSSPKHNPELLSETERKLQTMDLHGVITELETTGGLEGIRALSFRQAVKDKTDELLREPACSSMSAAEKTAFKLLITEQLEPLFEFGVLQPQSVDARHVAVKDPDVLLDCLDKQSGGSSAVGFNTAFNRNYFVRSDGIDDEQYSPSMGVIQAICCGMYHLMKTKDSPGDGTFRTFDRAADSYRDNQADALVEYVCNQTHLNIIDESGATRTLDVSSMISSLPTEIQKILKYIAKLKASRDDLGQKASNYIQIKNGKSAKLLGRGANQKQFVSGFGSRVAYKTAQTANNKEFMIALGFIDIRNIPESPPFDPFGNPIVTTPPDIDSLRAQEIFNKMMLMDGVCDYFRPGSSKKFRDSLNCTPSRWDQDYPALDEFCNRIDGEKAQKYKDARDAWQSILDEAYKSTSIKLPTDPTQMRMQIEDRLSDLFTKVAILTSYLGPFASSPPPPSPAVPIEFRKYVQYHMFPRAALKFTLRNVIFAVPGSVESRDQNTWFKLASFGAQDPNEELFASRRGAINVIREQILKYPSLGDPTDQRSYAYDLFDFLNNPWLVEESYLSERDRNRRWNTVRIKHTSSLKGLTEKQYIEEVKRYFTYPFVAAKDTSD